MREWHARDEAWQRARSFARRFGEPHVRLAMHGAVPIGLTPELLHLIRMNFVAATPWVAEADLLLSPLCRDVGGGFFEMDEELRGLLVEELQRDPDFGPSRLQAVADFLGAWADRVRESAPDPEWSDFVEGQALTALSYRKPEEAAEALARSLNSPRRGRAGIDARVIKLTQGLSSALMSQVEVVTYAVALDKLASGDVEAALEHFGALGPINQPVKIGNVELPAPAQWGIDEQQVDEAGAPTEAGDGAEESTQDVELIGESAAMQRVRGLIAQIAYSNATVLIVGETGTGKSLAGRAIHSSSMRSSKPFTLIDCSARPKALLEVQLFGGRAGRRRSIPGLIAREGGALKDADGGTVFLDEIGDLPEGLQSRILSVMQGQEFTRTDGALVRLDVRFLAATNRDLEAKIQERRFSAALYYQLINVLRLVMPPLRERGGDIMILAEHFAAMSARKARLPTPKIPPEVRECLLRYEWPGNVRELENVMERVVTQTSGGDISLKDLPREIRNVPGASGRLLIAYSSSVEADQRAVARIAESLNRASYDVFEAPQDLASDFGLTRMILSRIRESKAVIVVYGKESASSEWLSGVVASTFQENVALLPVALGESIPSLHTPLALLQHVFWNDSDAESSLQSLRAALDSLGRPTAPRPAVPRVYISCAPEDRHLGTAIREHLENRGSSVWLEDRNVTPRERGEPSLEFLLKPGNLMIVIVSEAGVKNEWLLEEVNAALEFGTRILPIRTGFDGPPPPPFDRLKHQPWIFMEPAKGTPVLLAEVDRYIAAFDPRSPESADDLYIETAAARDARRFVLSGSSLIVIGPRRSGKTALLRYLGRALEEESVATRYIDLRRESYFPPDATLLVDNVGDLKQVLDYFSRRQKQTPWVLATAPVSTLAQLYMQTLIFELQDFTLEETAELNRRFGSPLRPHQVEELFDLLDGHPYLTRAAITSAAQVQPVDVQTVSQLQPIEEELDLLSHELGTVDLQRAWIDLLSGARLDKPAQDSLLALGLAKKRNGRLVPRNRLYREFFARPRRDLHTVLISTPDRDLPCARAVRTWLESHNAEVLEFDEFGAPPESHAPRVEHLLDRADLLVGLIAEPFGGRGNLAEIEMAFDRYRREGRPKVFAVLVRRDGPPSELLSEVQFFRWDSDADTPGLLRELAELLGEDGPSQPQESPPEFE